MKINQVALQLYTLRDFCKTTKDFSKTMKRVREIGYQAVQVSGVGPLDESEIDQILQGEGLICCATHEPGEIILKEPHKIIDRLAKLGCTYTAYPYPAGIDLKSETALLAFVKNLDAAGEAFRRAGQVLCYHNHAHEFGRIGKRLILDLIFEETRPENLQAELDTYWVQYGGGNNVDWCKKLQNRLPLLHLKDFAIHPEKYQPIYSEIGSGNLNFKGIVEEAEKAGCQWFIVEQDTCPGDPFESIQKSFTYIQKHLLSS